MSKSFRGISVFSGLIVLGATLGALSAGCEDPAANKPKATVNSATPTGPASAAAPSGATPTNASASALAIDAKRSSVGFVGSKVTGSHAGTFGTFSGTIKLAGDKAEGGSVSVEIDVASVKTDSDKLDEHLKGSDFFELAKYPKATFASTEVKAGGEKGATHTITGNLTLRGVTKSITFPASVTISGDAVSATAEFSINRKDFGIVYAGKADDLIRDDVVLKLSLTAPRKSGG